MRGQGPGSDHERREAGGAPPTPPPSFGRRPPSEQGGPPAFPDDPAAQAWLTVEGEPPRGDAWQPAGAAPADAWLSVEEPGASRDSQVRESSADVPPVIGHPLPGAQPWEVQDPDGAAYDWFADDDQPAGVSASSWDEPAKPRWEPPPAFTAAAAGMQVWPSPVTDSPAMPPWPAATGELEPEDDTPLHCAPRPGAHRLPDPDSRPPQPDGWHPEPHHWSTASPAAAGGAVPPASPEGRPAEHERAGSSRYFDPSVTAPRPVPLSAPTPADQDAPPPTTREEHPSSAEELYPAVDPRPPYGVEPTRPSYDQDIPGAGSEQNVETRPGPVPPFVRKGGPGLGAGVPVQTPGPKGPPAPLFDPKLSPAAQQGATTPQPGTAPAPHQGTTPAAGDGTPAPHPMTAGDGTPTPHPMTAGTEDGTRATDAPENDAPGSGSSGRRTEPGDVPVWPPAPQRDEPLRDHLDLPFAPEVWGRPSPSQAQHDAHPSNTGPTGEPTAPRPEGPPTGPPEPRPDSPTADSPEPPPGSVIQGVPVSPASTITPAPPTTPSDTRTPPPGPRTPPYTTPPHGIPTTPSTPQPSPGTPHGATDLPYSAPGASQSAAMPHSVPGAPPETTPPHGTTRPPYREATTHETPKPRDTTGAPTTPSPHGTSGTPQATTSPHATSTPEAISTPPHGIPAAASTHPGTAPPHGTPPHGTPLGHDASGTPQGNAGPGGPNATGMPPANTPPSGPDTTGTGPHGGLVPRGQVHGGAVAPLTGRVPVQGDPGHHGELQPLKEGGGPGQFRQPPFPPLQVQEPPKSKRALFATLGVLVLAGVATGGFFAVRSANTAAPSGAATSAQAPTPTAEPTADPASPAPAGTSMLNSEITDPKTLSLKEAFPEKKVDAAGATFTRVKSEMAEDCADAASGPFAEALEEQKCSRVLRATYVDRKRRYAVTTGIAVLPSKDAAVEVDRTKDLDRNLWFRGLAGPEKSGAHRVHIAGGYAAGLVWGRYIVFSYATHADGHTPNGKEKTLVKVSSEFRDETAKVLERRITDN